MSAPASTPEPRYSLAELRELLQAVRTPAQNERLPRFRPLELGIFDPDTRASEFVRTVDKTIIYYNVFSFTARVRAKTLGVTEGGYTAANVAATLDQCLRGSAESWYTREICNTMRAGLKTSIELWCTELEARFKMSPNVALGRLMETRYTVSDVRKRKDPEKYLQDIMVLSRSADPSETHYAQMMTAYRHLAAELRIHITPPTPETDITTFMKQLRDKKEDWFDTWRPSHGDGKYPSSQKPRWSVRPGNPSFLFSYWRNPPDKSEADKGKTDFKQEPSSANRKPYWKKDAKQDVKSGRPRAYNTGEEADESGDSAEEGSNDPYNKAYYQGLESDEGGQNRGDDGVQDVQSVHLVVGPSPREMSAKMKTNAGPKMLHNPSVPNFDFGGQIQKLRPTPLVPKSEHKSDTTEHRPNIATNAEGGHKCALCGDLFRSGNKLHSHLRENHSKSKAPKGIIKTPSPPEKSDTLTERNTVRFTDIPEPSTSSAASSPPMFQIVKSTASSSKAPPGYAFRGRKYAQIKVALGSPANDLHSVCLDTGCGMSLISRNFLQQMCPTSKIYTMERPMRVCGLGSQVHDASQFVNLDLFLSAKNGVMAHVKREIHIVDMLDANILIGMDIASPEGWVIDLENELLTLPKCAGVQIKIMTLSTEAEMAGMEDVAFWPRALPSMTAALSNSTSHGTGVTATMAMYGSRIKEPLDTAAEAIVKVKVTETAPAATPGRAASEPAADVYPVEPANIGKYKPAMIKAIDSIKFAARFMKRYYDGRHKPMFFKPGDYASLRLHRGYNMHGAAERNTKIEQQLACPFKVLERVELLAYRIELPESMKVHPVISVDHLEPAPDPCNDQYQRPFSQGILQNPKLIPDRMERGARWHRKEGKSLATLLARTLLWGKAFFYWRHLLPLAIT